MSAVRGTIEKIGPHLRSVPPMQPDPKMPGLDGT
jgi:hypothetical protein